jgi:secreted PhoX family phosphatase
MRPSELENSGDVGCNPSANPTMGEIITARFSRRDLMVGALAVTAISTTLGRRALAASTNLSSSFDFKEIEAGIDTHHNVAEGYEANILLRWGDPVLADASPFDVRNQTAEKQSRQFGYNSDFVGYFPIENRSDHGLLVVNHEYTNEELMFPGIGVQEAKDAAFAKMTKELVDIEMAAHGGSVVEVRRADGKWQVVPSALARRITAETPMEITGPAAGSDRLKTYWNDGPRHAQQLRGRRDAMGHLAHGRGEFPRLFLECAARRTRGVRQLQALWPWIARLRLGQVP